MKWSGLIRLANDRVDYLGNSNSLAHLDAFILEQRITKIG